MSLLNRSLRLIAVTFSVSIFMFCACGEKKTPTDPKGLSERFIELFYIERDPESAAKLSTGFAAYKIIKRVQVPPGTQWSSGSNKPKAKFKFVSEEDANENEISYLYQVTFNSPEIIDRKVFVNMRQVDGKWLVHQFMEDKKVEKKSTDSTPAPQAVP